MIQNCLVASIFFAWSIILNLAAGYLICRPTSKKLFLFPFFEWFMTISFFLLWQTSTAFLPYFILFSALGVTISTDLSCMLISRFVSLYLAPTGIVLSFFNIIPLCWQESLAASVAGYLFFYVINKLFFMIRKQEGLGQGDFDLMALIGAYTGLLGIWFTILLGSIIGTITAVIYLLCKRASLTCLPFGPFLALATIVFVLFKDAIISCLI